MNYVLSPLDTYRKWRSRQKSKCVVRIENPRMKIKGMSYTNRATTLPRNNNTYVAFMGIPYAAPPIGPRRFQPPESLPPPPPPLFRKSKTIRAYDLIDPCLQLSSDGKLVGSEDCLYLNVYIQKEPKEIPELLPVLVYIHGDEFTHGKSSQDVIRPYNIMQHELVFVTINYRLGPFGFLNMGTDKCRGNAGLKDQVKALEWIRDNIANFKGDPSNVTICGHSAGATCVNLHLFSPLSKGLFRRAIIMSGGISCPWGFKKLDHVQKARRFYQRSVSAEEMGAERVVRKLSTMKATDLMIIADKVLKDWTKLESTKVLGILGPSEEYIPEGAFIPSRPLERLMEEATPVSVIAGITRKEGYMYFSSSVRRAFLPQDYLNMIKDPACFTKFLEQNFSWSEETAEKRRDELREMYFGDAETLKQMDFEALQGRLATFLTDLWFHRFYDNIKIGKERPTSEPLYVYLYDYQDEDDRRRHCENVIVTQDGPRHGDEIQVMFDQAAFINRTKKRLSKETNRVARNLCSLWANFCKNGNPWCDYEEIEWTPHTEENPSYLSIDRELIVKPGRLNEDSWPKLRDIILSEPVAVLTEESIPVTSSSKCLMTTRLTENFRR